MKERVSTGSRRNPATHKAIIDAACEILQDTGDLTFEEIARRSGAGKATIYRWWPNKIDLFVEVYRRQFKADDFITDSGDFGNDIVSLFSKIFTSWRNTVSGRAIRFLLSGMHNATLEERRHNFMPEHRNLFRMALERGQARGQLRAGIDLEIAVDMLMGLSGHCLLSNQLDPHEPHLAKILDIMLYGMAKPAPLPKINSPRAAAANSA
jgi:AcrR family transcriptional regulator